MGTQTLKVLSQALRLEREGREFYLQAADETASEAGRKMFLSLAEDEKLHAEMVQRQLHALEGDGKYVLLPDLSVEPIDLAKQLFPPGEEAVKAEIGTNASEIDALHVAIERETVSYDLYRQAAQDTDDEAGKQLYTWLSGAELTHYNLLMANYQSLVSSGGWV